jgi:hypothetical protein
MVRCLDHHQMNSNYDVHVSFAFIARFHPRRRHCSVVWRTREAANKVFIDPVVNSITDLEFFHCDIGFPCQTRLSVEPRVIPSLSYGDPFPLWWEWWFARQSRQILTAWESPNHAKNLVTEPYIGIPLLSSRNWKLRAGLWCAFLTMKRHFCCDWFVSQQLLQSHSQSRSPLKSNFAEFQQINLGWESKPPPKVPGYWWNKNRIKLRNAFWTRVHRFGESALWQFVILVIPNRRNKTLSKSYRHLVISKVFNKQWHSIFSQRFESKQVEKCEMPIMKVDQKLANINCPSKVGLIDWKQSHARRQSQAMNDRQLKST